MRKTFGLGWIVWAAIALTAFFTVAASAAQPDHPCYGSNYDRVADMLWQDSTEVDSWFRDHPVLAREIAATTCTFVFISKTGALNDQQVRLLRAKLKKTDVPEDIEEAQQGEGLEYYPLFAAIFYRHAENVTSAGYDPVGTKPMHVH